MARGKVFLKGSCLSILAMLTFMIVIGQPASADYTYFNAFEGNPATWTEWQIVNPVSPIVKATTPSGRNFLGRDPYYGFGNETAVLTLPPVPEGSLVTVDFNCLLSLLGMATIVGGGPGLIFGSFPPAMTRCCLILPFTVATIGRQSYPDNYYSDYPGTTGSSVGRSLGYDPPGWGDVIYDIEKSLVLPDLAMRYRFANHHKKRLR